MTRIIGFEAIANKNARLLILGSMPSEASLQQQQYYAHPRNAFWSIMLSILAPGTHPTELEYSQRKVLLTDNKFALWDVLQSCVRDGSLDSAIAMNSVKVNDFSGFFEAHPNINKVCFNGAKAEAIYRKNVLPDVSKIVTDIQYVRLPSTSPAHAAMSFQQKEAIWKKELKDHRL